MSKGQFYCTECEKTFAAAGKQLRWTDPLLGPCWKQVAKCPSCGKQANELKLAMKTLKRGTKASTASPGPVCATGTCPFVN